MSEIIPFFKPQLCDQEFAAVKKVLSGGWLTRGERCVEFERRFCQTVGTAHAVALNSCTAALELALRALPLQAGDIVLSSTYNFAAAAEVVARVGGESRFVDCEAAHLQIDPQQVEQACEQAQQEGRKVAVVMPVHFGGRLCNLEALDRLAAKYGFVIIEDAAHALPTPTSYGFVGGHRPQGDGEFPSATRAVCFSFYANKTLTTGEGGMLTTEDPEFARRVRRLSSHGMDRDGWQREALASSEGTEKKRSILKRPNIKRPNIKRPSWDYEVVELGTKTNFNDIQAAIGIVQLEKLHDNSQQRLRIAQQYHAELADCEWCQIPDLEQASSWHLFTLRVPAAWRDLLAAKLAESGIGTSVHYKPLHLHSYYAKQEDPAAYPVATREWQTVLSLPIYPGLSQQQVQAIATALREGMSQLENTTD